MPESKSTNWEWLSSKKMLIGGTVAAGILGLALYLKYGGSEESSESDKVETVKEVKKQKKKKVVEKPVEEKVVEKPAKVNNDELSYDDLLAMFNEMLKEIPAIVWRIQMQSTELQNSGAPEQQIAEYAQTAYPRMLEETHKRLLLQYNTTDKATDAACEKYKDDPKFIELMKKMEEMHNNISGNWDEEAMNNLPDSLTEAKTLEIFTAMLEAVNSALIKAMKEVYPNASANATSDEIDLEVKALFEKDIPERKAELFKRFDIEEKMLDLALKKHSQNPQNNLVQEIMKLQMKQQQTLGAVKNELTAARNK